MKQTLAFLPLPTVLAYTAPLTFVFGEGQEIPKRKSSEYVHVLMRELWLSGASVP
jgi:hypothetical protein